jgi:hypothetical protein
MYRVGGALHSLPWRAGDLLAMAMMGFLNGPLLALGMNRHKITTTIIVMFLGAGTAIALFKIKRLYPRIDSPENL